MHSLVKRYVMACICTSPTPDLSGSEVFGRVAEKMLAVGVYCIVKSITALLQLFYSMQR